jgi:hypothetical protein
MPMGSMSIFPSNLAGGRPPIKSKALRPKQEDPNEVV